MSMKVGVLGGSFDPPHKGHAIIANRLLKLNIFDQIWLMPLFKHPLSKNLSSPEKRLGMTKYLEKGQIKVSNLEINNKTTSYTIDTLKFLAGKYPKDKFSWIIGTDQIESLTEWKQWKEIINNFKLIVVPRAWFNKAERQLQDIAKQVTKPENIILIDRKKFPPIYISSTLIRQKIKAGKPISNSVPKIIERYIIQNNLYK
jgi:nicotinate-nucleotide adenylyltransferase